LPFIFFDLCISLWRSTFKISEILRGLITPVAVFVVFGLVPYLYCYSLTGNPVFPYFNGIFKSDYFYKSQSFNNPIFNQSLSYRTLYDMTFHGSWYLESLDHPISLTYLMFFAPIVYFIIQNIRKLKIILIACQVFLAAIGIYIFQSYFRYLLPSLVLYVVLIAALIEYLKTNQRQIYQISMFSIFLSLPISVIHIPDPTHNYKEFSWEKAIAREVEEDRLLRRPQQVVFDYLNSRYGTKATVFHIQQPLTAGLDGLSLVSVWYNPELSRRISLLKSMQDVKTLVKTYGITHFVSYSNDVSNEFVKSFLVSTTDIEMEHSNMTLYKVDFRKLPSANLLDAANIVSNVVSVELKESRNYLITQDFGSDLIMEGRDYVTVLNWLDRSGKSLDMRYIFERVSRQASYFDYFLRAPEEATTLVISLPTIDSKSFKDYQIQLVTIGDQTLIPSYQGD